MKESQVKFYYPLNWNLLKAIQFFKTLKKQKIENIENVLVVKEIIDKNVRIRRLRGL